MAATYRSGSVSTSFADGGGQSVAAGVTAAAGEHIYACLINRISSSAITNLAGWTTIGEVQAVNLSLWLFYRTAAGAESSWTTPSVSSTSNYICFVIGVIQGDDPAGTTFDSTTLLEASGSSGASTTLPELTGGLASGIEIDVFGVNRGMSGVTWTARTEAGDFNTGTQSTRNELSGGYALGQAPSGSVAPGTTGGTYGLIQAAIRPTGTTVAPATVAATAQVGTATVSTGSRVTAGIVAATALVAAVAVTADADVTPGAVGVVTSVGAVSVAAGATATLPTVAVTADIPAPTVDAATIVTTVTAVTVEATTDVPTPNLSAGAGPTPTAAVTVATVGVPGIDLTEDATVTAATVTAPAVPVTPTLSAGSVVLAITRQVAALVLPPITVGGPSGVDITVTIGATRVGTVTAAVSRSSTIQADDTRSTTIQADDTRSSTVDVDDVQSATVLVGDTRSTTVIVDSARRERGE